MEPKTIFINPKFKNAYINPNFLVPAQSNTIHLNPKFFNQQIANFQPQQPPLPPLPPPVTVKVPEPPVNKSAIIKNTKRSLIRAAPEKLPDIQRVPIKSPIATTEKKLNLIKISNTKLVNASQLMTRQQKENETIKKATESLIKAKKLQRKKANGEKPSIYKLDRRKENHQPVSPNKKKQRKIVKQYSIRSTSAGPSSSSSSLSPKKKSIVVTNRKLLKTVNVRDKKKYSMVKKRTKSKKTVENTAATTSSDNRYFDKEVNSSASMSLRINIPDRTKTAPTLPDFIKI